MKILVFFLLLLFSIVLANATREDNEIDNDIPRSSEKSEEELTRPRERVVSDDTVHETYERAVLAYLDEDWDACIQGFRDVIYKYKRYKATIIECRRKCRKEAHESYVLFHENVEDLLFYEKKVRETLCLLKCNQEFREVAGPNALKRLSRQQEWKIITVEHYGYLHLCYYQKKYFQEAANAVFTYLIYHPDHKASKASLAYYVNLPEINNKTIRNLEAEPFVDEYAKGVKAYEDEYYEEAVARLENSWRFFLKAEEDCRYYCEGPFEKDWNPDFVTALSNHYVYNLRCKVRCSRILSIFNGEHRRDFLVNHFNYLQFAYYQLRNLKKACEAVENYLLFYPSDDTMLNNKNYYSLLPMAEEEYFKPLKEIEAYVKRQEYEKHLLLYVTEEFTAFEKRVVAYESAYKINEADKDEQEIELTELTTLPFKITNLSQATTRNKSYFIADKRILGGESRFLLDGLINKTECESIIHLAKMTTWEGDGYENNKSPHSDYERFEGVTIGRLAVLTYFGLLESESLKFLLEVTETVREETEKIVNVDRRLYITYTHLVCRTALPDSPKNRSDYSHKIHADNCLAEYDGACHAESPAYTWRDYSTILYLNSNFEGGNFIFVKDKSASIIESTVRPKCGRMLSFSSGADNLHGVTAVTKGKRCALGLWFTFQSYYEDVDRELAEMVLRAIEEEGVAELRGSLDDVKNYEKYKRMLIGKLEKKIVLLDERL